MRVRHLSRYTYPQPVLASFNEVRLTPLRTQWQTPLESVLHVSEATWQFQYDDYWGTHVRVFESQHQHRVLSVDATSIVEVDDSRRPRAQLSTSWSDMATAWVADRFAEYLTPTPSSAPEPDLQLVASDFAAAHSPHETALSLATYIYDEMTYQPGSTGVSTSAAQAWRARRGVCQDYAHLLVGALRQVGIPARYVSGYLHPAEEPELGEPVVGESHAWVEWWLGEWTGHDPTNDAEVGERHVIVGRGRDYTDVPPIKGIVAGPAESDLAVTVEITRLA
jgi:transglutaminase-like putative cysteine protease